MGKKSKTNKKTPKTKTNENAEANPTNTITAETLSKASFETLQKIMDQADAAMDMSNETLALSLYSLLEESIRLRSFSSEQSLLLLPKIIQKVGECFAFVGNIESACDKFREANDILDAALQKNDTDTENESEESEVLEMRAGVFMYLGQLHQGQEALQEYQNGITSLEKSLELVERKVENTNNNNNGEHKEEFEFKVLQVEELRQRLCSAHCAIAELYMTDLCYDPDAEMQCESNLTKALKYDSLNNNTNNDDETKTKSKCKTNKSPEALQALANLRLSQNKGLEGAEIIMEAYQRIQGVCEELAKLIGLYEGDGEENNNKEVTEEGETKELQDVEGATSLPPFGFRIQTSKLLLECASILQQQQQQNESNDGNDAVMVDEDSSSSIKKYYTAAIHVLASLMAENDSVVEIYYLLGCAYQALTACDNNDSNNSYQDQATQYYEQALEMLQKNQGEFRRGYHGYGR